MRPAARLRRGQMQKLPAVVKSRRVALQNSDGSLQLDESV
jgi:hypothetical protein